MTLPWMVEIENKNKAHGGKSSVACAYINPIRPGGVLCALILFILGFLKYFNSNTMLKFLDFFFTLMMTIEKKVQTPQFY